MTSTSLPILIHGTHSDLVAFLILSIWPSHFGLPLLLIIILSSKTIQRHPTFISMCVTWIISGLSSSLLLYAGKTTGPEPPKMICLIQASLLYGVPPMASMGACLLVFQMFTVIRSSLNRPGNAPVDSPLRLIVMVSAPYVLFLIFVLATAFVGASNPESISRDRRFFYCSVHSHNLTDTLTLVSAAILLATLVFEIWIAVSLYKLHTTWKRQGSRSPSSAELNLPIRIIFFGLYVAIGMSLSVLNVHAPTSPAPDLILSTTSSAVVLLFGTQPDILRVICFWRRPKSPPDQDKRLSASSEKPINAP
jgi:hypothetical protein